MIKCICSNLQAVCELADHQIREEMKCDVCERLLSLYKSSGRKLSCLTKSIGTSTVHTAAPKTPPPVLNISSKPLPLPAFAARFPVSAMRKAAIRH
jgi:hypothetical protein